jgi:hypothetical protein
MYTGAAKIVRQKLSTSVFKENEKLKEDGRKVTIVDPTRGERPTTVNDMVSQLVNQWNNYFQCQLYGKALLFYTTFAINNTSPFTLREGITSVHARFFSNIT